MTTPTDPVPSSRLLVLCPLLLALAVRLATVYWFSDSLAQDPDAYRHYAETLVAKGDFLRDGRPSAWRPPLYPLLLAGIVASPIRFALGVAALQVVLGLATVWLVMRTAREYGLAKYSFVAGLIVALDPLLAFSTAQVMTETLAAFLAAAALLAAAKWLNSDLRRDAFAIGLLMGCGVLARPFFLPWAMLLAIWLLVRSESGRRWVSLALFVVGLALPLVPWALRNAAELGRPIVTTTHGGFTLLLANNPDYFEFMKSGKGTWNSREFVQSWQTERDARGVRSEVEEDRLAYDLALRNIRQAPGSFLRAAVGRVATLWSLSPAKTGTLEGLGARIARLAITFWNFALFGLALMGLLEVQRGRAASKWAPALLLVLALTAAHFFYWTDLRMRAPAMPAVALFAAAGWAWLAARQAKSAQGFAASAPSPNVP